MHTCAYKTGPFPLPSFPPPFILSLGRTRPARGHTRYKWITTYNAYYCDMNIDHFGGMTVSVKIDPKTPYKANNKNNIKNTREIFSSNPVVPPGQIKENAQRYNIINTGHTQIMGVQENRERDREKHGSQYLFISPLLKSTSSRQHVITRPPRAHVHNHHPYRYSPALTASKKEHGVARYIEKNTPPAPHSHPPQEIIKKL